MRVYIRVCIKKKKTMCTKWYHFLELKVTQWATFVVPTTLSSKMFSSIAYYLQITW